jgi:hypothetical protein
MEITGADVDDISSLCRVTNNFITQLPTCENISFGNGYQSMSSSYTTVYSTFQTCSIPPERSRIRPLTDMAAHAGYDRNAATSDVPIFLLNTLFTS